jgi:hypothetical protein
MDSLELRFRRIIGDDNVAWDSKDSSSNTKSQLVFLRFFFSALRSFYCFIPPMSSNSIFSVFLFVDPRKIASIGLSHFSRIEFWTNTMIPWLSTDPELEIQEYFLLIDTGGLFFVGLLFLIDDWFWFYRTVVRIAVFVKSGPQKSRVWNNSFFEEIQCLFFIPSYNIKPPMLASPEIQKPKNA